MKRTYNQPICALVNVNAQTILMGSGGEPTPTPTSAPSLPISTQYTTTGD